MVYKDKIQESINEAVYYLNQASCYNAADAVRSAAGQVLAYENGDILTHPYSKKVNRHLCESLFIMNSDPNCNPNHIRLVRRLIEGYREMNGMPTDTFEDDVVLMDIPVEAEISFGDVASSVAPTEPGETWGGTYNEYISDESDCGLNQFIIDNTEIGEEYAIEDIIEEVLHSTKYCEGGASHCDPHDYKAYDATQSDVITAIKSLIADGFYEVTERDEYNGSVAVIIRVK